MPLRHQILALCLLGGITSCSLDPDLWYGDGDIAENSRYPILTNIPPLRQSTLTDETREALREELDKEQRQNAEDI